MKKNTKVVEWVNNQTTYPSLIVAHYINKGQEFWEKLTPKQLETGIKNAYKKEEQNAKKFQKTHKIAVITASFTEAVSRGAYSLAHLDYDTRCEIIKNHI